MKRVYVAMSGDLIHHGHINIINKAKELGDVTVGLLTDSAIAEHKRLPYLEYNNREIIVSNISGVKNVIPQKSRSYRENLIAIKARLNVHGDDWKIGLEKN